MPFGYSEQVLDREGGQPRELEVAVYQYGDELVATYPGEICAPGQVLLHLRREKYSSASRATGRRRCKAEADPGPV